MPHFKTINTYLQIHFGFGRSPSLCQAAPVLILFAHRSKQQLPWKSQEIFGLLRTQLLMLLEFFPPPSVSTRIKTLVCWSISGFWHIWSFTWGMWAQSGVCVMLQTETELPGQGNPSPGHVRVLWTRHGDGGREKETPQKQKG